MKKDKLRLVVISALFAAFICVATMVVKIPTPLNGYINLGDCLILITAWLLPTGYGFLAAGIGSCFADILSGYTAYAPATFIIKGLMVVFAVLSVKLIKVKKPIISKIISAIIAEAFMVAGYYVFEGFMYGFAASLVNIPMNAIQGVGNLILALIISKALEGRDILKIKK